MTAGAASPVAARGRSMIRPPAAAATLPLAVDLGHGEPKKFGTAMCVQPGRRPGPVVIRAGNALLRVLLISEPSHHHHQVIPLRQFMLRESEGLADDPFGPIADDRRTDAPVDAEAEPIEVAIVGTAVNDEWVGGFGALGVKHRPELQVVLQSLRPWEAEAGGIACFRGEGGCWRRQRIRW